MSHPTASWLPIAEASSFPVESLPYGVFRHGDESARVGAAIGDWVLDLARLDLPHAADFEQDSLNRFMARGRPAWTAVRERITALLTDPGASDEVRPHLIPQAEVRLQLPFEVADFVDFYCVRAARAEPGDDPAPGGRAAPCPTGTTSRSDTTAAPGTVVVSGTPVRASLRPAA